MLAKIKHLLEDKNIRIVLLVTIIMRIWPIWHGFPFIYHPDEPTVINETLALPIRYFNPGHFDWPHLQYYLTFPFFAVTYIFNDIILGSESRLPYYIVARFIVLVQSVITVLFLTLLAKKFSPKNYKIIGLWAAFCWSLIEESHVATIDASMVMFLTISLYFAVMSTLSNFKRNLLLASIFAGLSTSVKYNGALSVVFVICAYVYENKLFEIFPAKFSLISNWFGNLIKYLKDSKYLFKCLFISVLFFFIGTPFALLDLPTFISIDSPKGAFWQFSHVGSKGFSSGILERLSFLFNDYIVMSLGVVGVFLLFYIIFIYKAGKRKLILTLPFVFIYLFYVSKFTFTRAHYLLPLYPVIIVSVSFYFDNIVKNFINFFNNISTKKAVRLFAILLLIQPIARSIYGNVLYTRNDTRTQAFNYITTNFPEGTKFVMGDEYEPKLDENKYPQITIKELLNNEDISSVVYPIFDDAGFKYVILGAYDLDGRYKNASYSRHEPVIWDYVLDEAKLLARFDPDFREGPTVMIFEVDYDYEVKKLHKTNEN